MSVVIPVPTADRLPILLGALPPVHEVIVVVGPGEEIVRGLPRAARMIRQTRTGAGNALACGVEAAIGDVVVTVPGDGSADPAELPRLVEALHSGADVAEGVHTPARFTDLILLWLMSVLLGCRPSGAGSGLRAFRRDVADRLGLPRVAGTEPARGDGRDGEPLITVRSRAAGLRVTEVPVARRPAFTGTPLLTGMSAVFRELLARRRAARATTPESIVVLTDGTARPAPPIIVGPEPGETGLNAPRRPTIDRLPAGPGPHRWPSPNSIAGHPERTAPDGAGLGYPNSTGLDYPNSAGLGFPDRRRGERRGVERRSGAAGRSITATGPASLPPAARPAGEIPNRRRWRENPDTTGQHRAQARPNLRVINGEGGGSDGDRGNLRSV
ncbi:glycosyltransferase [Actinoplanes hulinensis]|uniref:Glycosyltransferase n=1 Tax=Actinoplanes hulinensis TaxID=1144547 RepID=A0ABS7BC05_9ACTN|nr:glycosyltransferase [Actinoplanes hulinensis]MBW6438551.1 glycosyltransferase [Actinoplanes hulinensis]